MDILRKELNSIYESQKLGYETLDADVVATFRDRIAICAAVDGNCRIITDASNDTCLMFGSRLGLLLGISPEMSKVDSSDEDDIYNNMHPEDLVDKRMLEYEFFKFIDGLATEDKLRYKATCMIRIKNRHGDYVLVSNTTQILQLSPAGKIWLILCCYDFADNKIDNSGISPRIVNNMTGECITPDFSERRSHILTDREKEILRLIKAGKLSKQIADTLSISIHTVNRHRQNILEKLSVGNSIEAIAAATAMNLM